MSKVNFQVRLQELRDNEFSSTSRNQHAVISGYQSLIDILLVPQINRHLHGHHELLFQCICRILLTPCHQYLTDDQVKVLLELASNSCILSMSHNQTIDGWCQNIEERAFEEPDNYGDDDDDEDWYDDTTESEDEKDARATIQHSNQKLDRNQMHSRPQRVVDRNDLSRHNFTPKSSTATNYPLSESTSNRRGGHIPNARNGRSGHHQNSERNNQSIKSNSEVSSTPKPKKGTTPPTSNTGKTDRHQAVAISQFDNKYGVDLQFYDCYNCGEYGHVRHNCPKKRNPTTSVSRDTTRPSTNSRADSTGRQEKYSLKSFSANQSHECSVDDNNDRIKIQRVYDYASKLLNSCQTTDERNKTLRLFYELVKQLEKQHGQHLSKVFVGRESIFYPLVCHVAQNEFLFTDNQYSQIYQLRKTLLPNKHMLLNGARSSFSRQRLLIPLNIIAEHIETASQIQQSIFNDFQEYIIRSQSPISTELYNLIKNLIKSSIYIDVTAFEHMTKTILLDLKKNIFSDAQLAELNLLIDIRINRLNRKKLKQIWKARLNLFEEETLSADLNQWILEFGEFLKADYIDKQELTGNNLDHAMWYFAVLSMASSGHLTKEQYENLFQQAIQSALFNPNQKIYFQFYLDHGQAPITMKELKAINIQLKSQNTNEKHLAYEQIKTILERDKLEIMPEKIEQSPPEINISTENNNQSNRSDEIIPMIDNHILDHLISLVEMICLDQQTFSNKQRQDLLEKFLYQSKIVRPLSKANQRRLKSFCSDSLSLNEFSNEQCRELKSVNNAETVPTNELTINPIVLNQLLNRILQQDSQAYVDFFILLDNMSQTSDFKQINSNFEVIRCLFSTIILVITDTDCGKASNIDVFRQRLKIMMDKQSEFFSLLLTEQQLQLINSRFIQITTDINLLINTIQMDSNERTFSDLMDFIRKNLKDKADFEKLISLILSTFDGQFLSIQQTLQLATLLHQHPTLDNNSSKLLLQFLIELLQVNIHSSPTLLLNQIETSSSNDQIIAMLKASNGNHATATWKKVMVQLLILLFNRDQQNDHLRQIARESPMLQLSTFQEQLKPYWQSTSNQVKGQKSQDDQRKNSPNQLSTIPKNSDSIDHATAHREIFRLLESDDSSLNAFVVQQCRQILLDEQLPSIILLPKFIEALEIMIKKRKKFSQIPLTEWARLIAQNRGKIFLHDAQCDHLLITVLFARLNLTIDSMTFVYDMIQSRREKQSQEGVKKLLLLLRNTKIIGDKEKENNLPTIADELYDNLMVIVFDERFNNNQVRQCITAAKNSWLLNDDHRRRLSDI